MPTTISLGYTIFYVDDVAATVQFFTTAFGFEQRMVTPENDYGEVETGATTLAFVSIQLAKSNLDGAGGFVLPSAERPGAASITLLTANVTRAVEAAIAAGGRSYVDPIDKPWGQTVAYVLGPSNLLIEIATPGHNAVTALRFAPSDTTPSCHPPTSGKFVWNTGQMQLSRFAGRVTIATVLALAAMGMPPAAEDVAAAGDRCGGALVTISGTGGDDMLRGTDGPDVIAGRAGNDVIHALGGDDIICAGAGDDRVFAGAGDNIVFGGPGVDKLRAAGGRDVINGGPDRDFIKGGSGDDSLDGGRGSDRIRGLGGDDTIDGGGETDVLWGGPGDDLLDGGAGADIVKGSAGTDECLGGPGVDYFDESCDATEPGTVRVMFTGSFAQLGTGADAGPVSICAGGGGCFGVPVVDAAGVEVPWADIEAMTNGETIVEPWGRWRSGYYLIEADHADDASAVVRNITEIENPYRSNFTTPCAPPAGGWPWPPLQQQDRDNRELVEYMLEHPNDFGTRVWDGWYGVTTVLVARNIEQHRAAMPALTDTPLCLHQVDFSSPELQVTQLFLGQTYRDRWRDAYEFFGSGSGNSRNRVTLSLTSIDPDFWADVGDLAPMIHPEHSVEVLDGTVADLPDRPLQLPPTADDFYIACNGRPIDPTIFDEPADDHLDGSPSTAIFTHPSYWPGVADAGANPGWWRVHEAPGTALYVSDGEYTNTVGARLRPDGIWVWAGSSTGGQSDFPCAMTRQTIGFSTARWNLDPDRLPRPEQRSISTRVTEGSCTGATLPGERLLDPVVEETAESVTITFVLRPQPAGFYTCPGNPSTPVVVTLAEPLGARVLLDGQTYPANEPTASAWATADGLSAGAGSSECVHVDEDGTTSDPLGDITCESARD